MWHADVYGHAVFGEGDKELAILECKRYSSGEYAGTEVRLIHNGKIARIYYDGHLCENMEE
jgi:hypothetical protein